jgi:hypothetical protein
MYIKCISVKSLLVFKFVHATYRTKWRSEDSYLNKFSLQRFESRLERSDYKIKSTNRGHEGVQRKKKYSSSHSQPQHEKAVGGRHTPSTLHSAKRRSTHCTGGWVGLREGLEPCGKPRPHLGSNPEPPST